MLHGLSKDIWVHFLDGLSQNRITECFGLEGTFHIYKERTIRFQFYPVLPLLFYENINKKHSGPCWLVDWKCTILFTVSYSNTAVLCNDFSTHETFKSMHVFLERYVWNFFFVTTVIYLLTTTFHYKIQFYCRIFTRLNWTRKRCIFVIFISSMTCIWKHKTSQVIEYKLEKMFRTGPWLAVICKPVSCILSAEHTNPGNNCVSLPN